VPGARQASFRRQGPAHRIPMLESRTLTKLLSKMQAFACARLRRAVDAALGLHRSLLRVFRKWFKDVLFHT
jgi:hypothetical protein